MNDMDDSGFGVGHSHSYKMYYQLARLAPAPDGGREPEWTRSGERFLIVIASGGGLAHLNQPGSTVEFINFEDL